MRVVRARGQRAESARTLAIRHHSGLWYRLRRTLLGLLAIFAAALVNATACSSSSSEDTAFMAKSHAAMARMMAAMQITPFNDVDRDFVAMMVPHHQGAIDMAQAELSYGHNARLRRLAQEIIVTQQEEIVEMRLALASVAASPSTGSTGPEDVAFVAKSHAAMTRMMAAMRIMPASDADRDFVAMMVPHHLGAIDMAQAELSYGHNEPLRGLAQEIIATQEEQIVVMRRIENAPLAPVVPSFHQPAATEEHL